MISEQNHIAHIILESDRNKNLTKLKSYRTKNENKKKILKISFSFFYKKMYNANVYLKVQVKR